MTWPVVRCRLFGFGGGSDLKELCKLKKKELQALLPQLAAALATTPLFMCRKCGRVAPEKGWLCKPSAVSKVLSDSPGDFELMQSAEGN